MDGGRSSGVATFFCEGPLVPGRPSALGEGEAHHARVRRLEAGQRVRLINGTGAVAFGTLSRLTKTTADVAVESVSHLPALPSIHLFAPIADRDRMLWLAEKATELGLTSWRGVMWGRSRGVSPRGEGEAFHAKLRARMISALAQSGGAWLPAVLPDANAAEAVAMPTPGARLVLDATGEPMMSVPLTAPVTIAVGPEGGLDDEERHGLATAGWMPVSLGLTTLRFETAGTAALAIARAAFAANEEGARG